MVIFYDYDCRSASTDPFWKRREETELREMQAIKRRLKQYHGGIFDEYGGLGADVANRLRRQLEEHEVAYWAARDGRDPTPREMADALKRLKPVVQHAKAAGTPWTWKPVKGPPGTGYETQNGRATLHPSKGKEWSLTLDGKEHPIHSRKPGFGHAETILQRELGRDYDRRASR